MKNCICKAAGSLAVLLVGLSVLLPASAAQTAPADTVTVVMTDLEPFVMNRDGEPSGFYHEIWDEIARSLGVDYQVVWVDSFADLLPAIADGRAEIAVAPLAPTAEREADFDFTSAVISSGPQLGVSERLEARPSLIRSLFDWRVIRLVAVAVAALFVVGHVMWFVERNRGGEDGDFNSNYVEGVWDGFWWSTVTATTVGYGDMSPKSVPGRVVALALMLASLVLVGAFVSQVTSIMTEDFAAGPETLGEVEGAVAVVHGTSFADYVLNLGGDTRAYASQEDAFEGVRIGEVDAVVANPFALAALDERFGIEAVGDVLYEEFETFGLAQGSLWREPINQALADLQSSGEIAELIKDGLN